MAPSTVNGVAGPERAGVPTPTWVGDLFGAPLDVIKGVAAVLMVIDHVNTVLFDGAFVAMWRLGRISYPLFAFVLACQVLRGADRSRALATLLLAGIATQPIYAAAFDYGSREASILFTLAAGFALAEALVRTREPVRHLVLAAGIGSMLLAPHWARSGVDFGLAGIVLPGALALAIVDPLRFGPWAAATLFALNFGNWKPSAESALAGAGLDFASALSGGALIVLLARRLTGRPRFLGRYALHAFYPAHLLALAGLRAFAKAAG